MNTPRRFFSVYVSEDERGRAVRLLGRIFAPHGTLAARTVARDRWPQVAPERLVVVHASQRAPFGDFVERGAQAVPT